MAALLPLMSQASVGWPANYGGVMLQGFYWDSYAASKWYKFINEAQEYGEYFDLIWVPNSGSIDETGTAESMGYMPVYRLTHNTVFGSQSDLIKMISLYKESYNTGFIADVVINHQNGKTSWCDFVQESVTGPTTGASYSIKWDLNPYKQICKSDEAASNGYTCTGASDTGEDFNGGRDLDHTNSTTQANMKTYLNFLLKELGYVGFRLDMTKGYGATYTGTYNSATNPTYSVGEYWDGSASKLRTWLNGTKKNSVIQSATFDFALKYPMNSAFGSSSWSSLSDKGLAADASYNQFAVTFVDNHDTGQKSNADCLKNNVAAANAFILTMPGTPCVFLRHWIVYNDEIKNFIKARRAAGITNQSSITTQSESNSGYILAVKGTAGSLYLQLGGATSNGTPSGYKLVQSGTNYKLFITSSLDWENVAKDGSYPGYPIISKAAGNYTSSVTTTVKGSKSTTKVVYTTDGSTPTTESATFTGTTGVNLTFTKSTTLKAGVVCNGQVQNVKTYIYNIVDQATTGITIYVRSSAPSTHYIWCWKTSNTSTNYTGGTWPGKALSSLPTVTKNGATWYYLKINESNPNVSIVFNSGSSNSGYFYQTTDLTNITTDRYFVYPDGDYAFEDYAQDVTEENSGSNENADTSEKVYILGNASEAGWDPSQGFELTSEDGENYTGTFTLTDASEGYGWFSFTTKLGNSSSDWSSIKNYRFGATTNDYLLDNKLGTTITCGAVGTSSDNAFKLIAGRYTIDLVLSTHKFVINKASDSTYATGDVNGDADINIADVNALISIILGNSTESDYAGVADVNGDADINIADVNAVIAIILGN